MKDDSRVAFTVSLVPEPLAALLHGSLTSPNGPSHVASLTDNIEWKQFVDKSLSIRHSRCVGDGLQQRLDDLWKKKPQILSHLLLLANNMDIAQPISTHCSLAYVRDRLAKNLVLVRQYPIQLLNQLSVDRVIRHLITLWPCSDPSHQCNIGKGDGCISRKLTANGVMIEAMDGDNLKVLVMSYKPYLSYLRSKRSRVNGESVSFASMNEYSRGELRMQSNDEI